MTKPVLFKADPKLDLVLERNIDVPRELVWTAWTTPKHIRQWFVPAPWTITDCEIDLRPGGSFRTVMRSPVSIAMITFALLRHHSPDLFAGT